MHFARFHTLLDIAFHRGTAAPAAARLRLPLLGCATSAPSLGAAFGI
jgi:hypothetical protein